MEKWYIYLYLGQIYGICMVNVGEYTMNPMGNSKCFGRPTHAVSVTVTPFISVMGVRGHFGRGPIQPYLGDET